MNLYLKQFNKTPGVVGSAIVSHDGIPIYQELPQGYEREAICALCASIVSHIQTTFKQIQNEQVQRMVIEAADGGFLVELFELGMLLVLVSKKSNLGLVRLEMKNMMFNILTKKEFGE